MKNVFTLLAKTVLIPLGLTAAALTVNAGIHKKNVDSNLRFRNNTNNIKQRNGRYHENGQVSQRFWLIDKTCY